MLVLYCIPPTQGESATGPEARFVIWAPGAFGRITFSPPPLRRVWVEHYTFSHSPILSHTHQATITIMVPNTLFRCATAVVAVLNPFRGRHCSPR